jgi:hypothetical protein
MNLFLQVSQMDIPGKLFTSDIDLIWINRNYGDIHL